jgi:ribosomal protein L37E
MMWGQGPHLTWLNRVLRNIFGPKRDEVTGEWRKLHNEELRDLYSSPSTIRIIKSKRIRWAGHVARMGEKRNAYRLLVGKPEGKKPLGRPRRRWVDNIRMDLGEVGPPLWSSGQSSWLQIRRPGFDSRHYQKKKCSGSGTGCTQPREYKLRSYLIEK